MKTIMTLVACMITTCAIAQMRSYTLEEATVKVALDLYADATGKRIDLVQGEHKPITLAADKVSTEFMLQEIESALEKQNLKLFEISDKHMIVTWIEVPQVSEKKQRGQSTARRRFGGGFRSTENESKLPSSLDLYIEGNIYAQFHFTPNDTSYAKWNPSESACPTHPTNAISLAISAVNESIPEITDWRFLSISLETRKQNTDSFWFYSVKLRPVSEYTNARKTTTIVVGVNGHVPAIEKHSEAEWEKVKEERRKEIRKNLEQYQIEVLRTGMPPLAIPLTPELKKRLEEEGIPLPERYKEQRANHH